MNAACLFFDDPARFENQVLEQLGLEPARITTQILPPEPLQFYLNTLVGMAGVLANMADDFRNLQRTEINEVCEVMGRDQVASSTMSNKQNPIGSEQVKSFWKVLLGLQLTAQLDQLSDHQRDLTNSASSRFTLGEMLGCFTRMLRTSTRVLTGLSVNRVTMADNLTRTRGLIAAEPLQLLLSFHGCTSAHERVRVLSNRAREFGRTLPELAAEDTELTPFLARMSDAQRQILRDPTQYVGIAEQRALEIADFWAKRLGT